MSESKKEQTDSTTRRGWSEGEAASLQEGLSSWDTIAWTKDAFSLGIMMHCDMYEAIFKR